MNARYILALVLALWWGAAKARSDFIISVQNLTLNQGASGYVDVFVSSNNNDTLSATSLTFQITTAGGTLLAFTNSPSPSADPTFARSSYVFFGNSGDQANSFPFGTASPASGVPGGNNDQFSGGDSTANFGFVTIGSTPQLLAMLPVTTATALPANGGDRFTVSVNSANTSLVDQNFNPVSFTATSGEVTVATPEPSCVALTLATAGIALGWCRRRRRAVASAP
jgi:hypothetical protein